MSVASALAGWAPVRRAFARFTANHGVRRGADGRPRAPWIERRRDRPYLVLLYHRVNDDRVRFFAGVPVARFSLDLERMLEQGPALRLAELVERSISGDVPPGAWALTFDDGYRDNLTQALPVLRRWGVPATIFLTTGPIDDRGPLWHDRVFDAFAAAPNLALEVEGVPHDLSADAGRRAALQAFLAAIRRLEPEARTARIDALVARLGVRENSPSDRMLTWEEARAMKGQGIDFGGHTVTHPILTRMPLARAAEEIAACRARIAERLGVPVSLFAYPNGSREDWNTEVAAAVRDAGYRAAVTTEWGANRAGTDPFALHRVGLWHADAGEAAARLAWERFAH